jgi:hypothetical protein
MVTIAATGLIGLFFLRLMRKRKEVGEKKREEEK